MARIIVDSNKKHQTMESFGASGAWWAQIVGGWDETDKKSGIAKRERIAELLCNEEKGIGIKCYRYNLGGGSKNSGSCTFSSGSRGAESFDLGNGKYDWSRDKNAVYMMKECVKNGADEVILFSNSPPESLTKNHKSCLDKPWFTNLSKENEVRFVKYLLDCAEHFVDEGIPVKYISPVNEPVWVWTECHNQEGCHYNPSGVKRLMHKLAVELEKRPKLNGVKISGAENGDLRWFNKTYCRVMLNDPVIRRNIDAIDTHSYFLPLSIPLIGELVNDRLAFVKRYKKFMDKHYPGVSLKISEWTHMQAGRDYGMDSALVQAKTMYEDISLLDATSWQNWIAVSDVDYCDGLIYINEDRSFEMTKRYYAFGNFSKFIKKGDVRVEASSDDKNVLPLCFTDGKTAKLVAINLSEGEKQLQLPNQFKDSLMFVTSEKLNLEKKPIIGCEAAIPKRSVVTIIEGVEVDEI